MAFTDNSNLKRHIEVHTDNKLYQCSACDKEYSDNESLKGHACIHTGEMSYKCNQCDKAFSDKSELITHVKTHTEEFVCLFAVYLEQKVYYIVNTLLSPMYRQLL